MAIDYPAPDENIFKNNPFLHFQYDRAERIFYETVAYAELRSGKKTADSKESENNIREKFKQDQWKNMGDQTYDLNMLVEKNLEIFKAGAGAVLEKHNHGIFDQAPPPSHLTKEQIDGLKKEYDAAEKEAQKFFIEKSKEAGNDKNKLAKAAENALEIRKRAVTKINSVLLPQAILKEKLGTIRGKPLGNNPDELSMSMNEEIEINKFRLSTHPPQCLPAYCLAYTSRDIAVDFTARSKECELIFRDGGMEKTLAELQKANPKVLEYKHRLGTFDKMQPYLKQDGRDATTAHFAASFRSVVPEHIKREQLRAEFIEAIKASKDYGLLKTDQEKADHLSVRLLMETYKLSGREGYLSISGYGTSVQIKQALEKQLESNRKDGKDTQLTPMQKAKNDFEAGVNPKSPEQSKDHVFAPQTPVVAKPSNSCPDLM